MNNEDRRRKAEMLGLLMMHCASQQAMYAEALKKSENGYEPKTQIFESLTIAETHTGGVEVVEIVAAILAGAKHDALNEPVDVLTDLIMALKYKCQFYDPKKEPNNEPVKILSSIYSSSLEVAHRSLYNGEIPQEIAEKVTDLIYE